MVDGNRIDAGGEINKPHWEADDGKCRDGDGWVSPILANRPEIQRIAFATGMAPAVIKDRVVAIWQWAWQFNEPHPTRPHWTLIPGMTLDRVQHNVLFRGLTPQFWEAYQKEDWGGFEPEGFAIGRLWDLFKPSDVQASHVYGITKH